MKIASTTKTMKIKMRMAGIIVFVFTIMFLITAAASAQTPIKHRLIVITDIGNEPDDFMSMVRLMLYSNQIDIEGLIASTSIHQSKKVSPELIKKVINAYGKVQPNLLKHEPGYPDSAKIIELIKERPSGLWNGRSRQGQRFGRIGLDY
jgi:hypothetical protein